MSKDFKRRNPVLYFSLAAAVVIALLFYYLYFEAEFQISLYACWLMCINIAAFIFYGYDKFLSLKNFWRVPELVLHLLALAGGFVGAFCGMKIFRHKTRKFIFIFIIIFAALIQVLIYYYI
ncbi:MAG: DUF1294 domain-containing protein [Synergistaceae bacterium]|nr:DUF1294 domain-containing protein [Synergistaceae bacterium]